MRRIHLRGRMTEFNVTGGRRDECNTKVTQTYQGNNRTLAKCSDVDYDP